MSATEDTVLSIVIEGFCMTCSVIRALFVSFFRFFVPPNPKSVSGEIVVVTGSGGAIGRGLSRRLSELGAVLVLWDIDEVANNETADLIRAAGGTCYTFTVDVGDRDAVFKAAQIVSRDIGDVSMVINNAGVVIGRRLLDCPDDEIERTFNVNLLAQFWTVKSFLPTMLRRNHGHIVNISSSTGLVGLKNLTDYSSSKYGVVGFTEVLHYEIVFSGYTGVHTTLVCPAFVKSKLFDGCKYRFPAVLPPLEVDECVNRIVQAILTNQIFVCIPRIVYFFSALKTILPVRAMNELIQFLGAANFMNTFVGKKDSRAKEANGKINESEPQYEDKQENGNVNKIGGNKNEKKSQ